MSDLEQWEGSGWVSKQSTSAEEIAELLQVVSRALEDCRAPISVDARFQIAYQAVLTLGSILVRASGYRVERANHHYRTLQSIAVVLGKGYDADCRFLDGCRKRRNELSYCRVGVVTERDTADVLNLAARLRDDVDAWLAKTHAELSIRSKGR